LHGALDAVLAGQTAAAIDPQASPSTVIISSPHHFATALTIF
jgi:hypothetical protein